MKRESKKKNLSGQITVICDVIGYSTLEKTTSYCQNWSLPISQIKIIGEYTNSNGPYVDDYFFVFVLADGSWRQASFYAEGRESFLTELSSKLGYKLECGLCNSTSLKSRIMWPEELNGEILFTFACAPDPKNFFAKFLHKLSPTFLFEFSEPVRKALNK